MTTSPNAYSTILHQKLGRRDSSNSVTVNRAGHLPSGGNVSQVKIPLKRGLPFREHWSDFMAVTFSIYPNHCKD